MFTLTYYLAIGENQNLEFLFPSFSSYVIFSSIIGIPLLSLVGYLHLKKSKAYSSDQDITAESYPYNFKLPPGIHKECLAPMYLELLRLGVKSLEEENVNDEELTRLIELERKLKIIAEGNSLPRPKKYDEI